jgi:hypothetical protein
MQDWTSYSLTDFLLFAPRTYYRLFALHNADLWPLHVAVLAAGAGILVLAFAGRPPWRGRAIAGLVAAAWFFVAWAWLLQRYDGINFAGRWFAAAFALQGVLVLLFGTLGGRLDPVPRAHPAGMAGAAIFAAALALYPLLSPAYGRGLASAEVFALAPDPTAVGTLGLLLLPARVPWLLLPIPLAWCAVTGLTLWTMEAPDAFVAPLAALVVLGLAAWKARDRVAGA